jgi:hypothetical protein
MRDFIQLLIALGKNSNGQIVGRGRTEMKLFNIITFVTGVALGSINPDLWVWIVTGLVLGMLEPKHR